MEPGALPGQPGSAGTGGVQPFSERLGVAAGSGDASQHGQIRKNASNVIDSFQGMFDRKLLTFNPGWHSDATAQTQLTDVCVSCTTGGWNRVFGG